MCNQKFFLETFIVTLRNIDYSTLLGVNKIHLNLPNLRHIKIVLVKQNHKYYHINIGYINFS